MNTPPRILVIGFHIMWDRAAAGDGGWANIYRAEIEKVAPGCRVDFRSVLAGKGGTAYEDWAATAAKPRGALVSIDPPPLAWAIERDHVVGKGYDLVVLAAWSAGYAAIRALLAEARRVRHVPSWLDVVACLDSAMRIREALERSERARGDEP